MIEERLRAALALEPGERREVVSEFFTAHPVGGSGPLGLGRAIADFVDWEIRSGRITEGGGGSPWWRLVNGGMILDLRDAAALLAGNDSFAHREPAEDGDPGADDNRGADRSPVAAWAAYARSAAQHARPDAGDKHPRDAHEDIRSPGGDAASAQTRLWVAHQASLHAALDAADDAAPLAYECPAEREFAKLVVHVVDATAEHCRPTDTDELARMTARQYPHEYPITPAEWQALHEHFAPLLD